MLNKHNIVKAMVFSSILFAYSNLANASSSRETNICIENQSGRMQHLEVSRAAGDIAAPAAWDHDDNKQPFKFDNKFIAPGASLCYRLEISTESKYTYPPNSAYFKISVNGSKYVKLVSHLQYWDIEYNLDENYEYQLLGLQYPDEASWRWIDNGVHYSSTGAAETCNSGKDCSKFIIPIDFKR